MMRLSELAGLLECETLCGAAADADIGSAYTSDLLSDVMGHAHGAGALITIQAHRNTVAVASLAGIQAVVLCNSRPIEDGMLDAARDEGIAIYRTALSQFEASGRLWAALRGLLPRE
jgi:hypothetical protein